MLTALSQHKLYGHENRSGRQPNSFQFLRRAHRASLYADAANQAASQAIQIADRWHLLRNLSDALTGVLAPHHQPEAAHAVSRKPELPPAWNPAAPAKVTRAECGKQRSRERRFDRYESVMEQVRKGMSQAAISRMLGIDRRTVRRWIRANGFPERKPVFRTNSVDEYHEFLDQRWEEGCHNASQSWREVRELGFTGMYRSQLDQTTPRPASIALLFRADRSTTASRISTAYSMATPEAKRNKQTLSGWALPALAGDCRKRQHGTKVLPHRATTGAGRSAQTEGLSPCHSACLVRQAPMSRRSGGSSSPEI